MANQPMCAHQVHITTSHTPTRSTLNLTGLLASATLANAL